jgi:Glycosyltransferase family 87
LVEALGHSSVSAQPSRAYDRFGDTIRRHTKPIAEVVFFIFVPLYLGPLLIFQYLIGTYHAHPITVDGVYFPDGGFLFDLHTLWAAGHNVVTGHSVYPFVYPAPAAIIMVPFGLLPFKVAVVAFSLVLIGAAFLTLRLLGVRDWRCYGAALGSLPGVSAVTLGAFSWGLALTAAAAWRYRDRRYVAAIAIMGALVTKIFLWPLVIWLLATRRARTAANTVVLSIVTVIGCWAMIGFDGFRQYPSNISHVGKLEEARSYSPFSLLRTLGMTSGNARLALVWLALAAFGAIVAAARTDDGDRRAFVLAIAACLVLSPIVWVHYLVLLFVVIALYRPRLSAAWLIPLVYWLLPGQDSHGSTKVILVAYAMTAAVALAVWWRRPSALRLSPAPR